MKKFLGLIGSIVLLTGLCGCDFLFGDDDSESGTQTFYTLNKSNNGYNQKTATLVATGSYCKVWYYDENKSYITLDNSIFTTLASKFDTLYKKETGIFGSNIPTERYSNIVSVESDTKIDILVSDIFNDSYSDQSSGTFGYFSSIDMITQDYLTSKNPKYKSNEREMFYIDSYFLSKVPEQVYSTLAHEFQHMLSYVVKNLNYCLDNDETWYDEMMSMCAEELLQNTIGIDDEYSPKSRLRWTNVGSNLGFSSIFDVEDDISGSFDYANAYFLGTYLMHKYNGVSIVKKIASNKFLNSAAVLSAVVSTDSNISSYQDILKNYGIQMAVGYFPAISSSDYPLDKITLSDYPIDLTDYDSTINSYVYAKSTDLVKSSSYPYIYKADAQIKLWPTGFTVHSLGTVSSNGSTYAFTVPSNSDIKIMLYCNGYTEDITSKTSVTISSSYSGYDAFIVKSNIGDSTIDASDTGTCTTSISYSSNYFANFNDNYSEPLEDDSIKYHHVEHRDNNEILHNLKLNK